MKTGLKDLALEVRFLFALATKTVIQDKEVGLLVGLYGSFVDALDNM